MDIDHQLEEHRSFPPPKGFSEKALLNRKEDYQKLWEESVENPETFFGRMGDLLIWEKKWDRVLNKDNPPFFKWFEGGKINISVNCIDRHLEKNQDKIAILWEGEPEGESESITYLDLHQRVCQTANALLSLGVQKGDRVVIYLPMIPQLAVVLLACARIGAVHSVIFAGFSAPALVDRINDAGANLVITSDGGFRRGQILKLKDIVDEALKECPTVQHTLVVRRTGQPIHWEKGRDLWYHELVSQFSKIQDPKGMDSEDPLFILYTSGSTGKPKGILHSTAGYLLGANLTCKYVFDLKPEDRYWCTADIGWVTGHSYVLYGPLSMGATTVMYEGAPNFPDFGRFWRLIEKIGVTILYTAPTAIRTFMKWGEEWPQKADLSSLRLLGSVGEPINPEAWMWYHRIIGREKCPIVDTWWQTETGSIMISPLPGWTPTRPGSATIPFFGVDPCVVNEKGEEVAPGKGGYLVIKKPWPSMLRTLYKDDERFLEYYWSRFKEQGFYLAGDGAIKDELGYYTILGRIDDVINVSGHRLSTMELESALVSHPSVVEAAVVAFDHPLKGSGIAAFVIPTKGVLGGEGPRNDLGDHVKNTIGSFARPDQIRFTEALPKTRSGKIMRRLLRDIASGNETVSDTSTLEDYSSLARLREEEG